MAQIRNYSKLAEDIIKEVGGEENIINATRCATRLRLVLKETPTNAKEKISSMAGVITVVENNGQFQVVIGTHVGDVYQKVAEILKLDEKQQDGGEQVKQGVLNKVIATMSAVFAPFIYILAAGGILQGILILINLAVPEFSKTGTYEILSLLSWTPFTFLPVFIAITASKHFKCNLYIAVVCCLALVNPTLIEMAGRVADGESIRFLIFPLSETTYTSSVLPPLFLVWILSYLEHFLEKKLPDVIKPLVTPLICLVVMVPFTILLLGPISTLIATGIANGYNSLVAIAPPVAAAIIGGLWQVVVIFGVHWGITPVCLANFDMYGRDSFQAFQTVAVIAQMGAAFGVFLKSRNKEFKGVALSAGITGIFGITEPSIYGVTLRLKKPFICGCIAGAVGAVVTSLFNSYYYVYAGLPGLLTTVNAINKENPTSFLGEIIGCAIAIVGSIILVQIIGFDDPVSEVAKTTNITEKANVITEEEKKISQEVEEITSPMTGKAMNLSEVPDAVFSSGMMGAGFAIEPTEYRVYAPVDGEIASIFDTKHAIGIQSTCGTELLIHVGLDTVELKGKYFVLKKQVGDQVKKGDLLLEFDGEAIKQAGYSLVTPVILTGSDSVIFEKAGEIVQHGEKMVAI
ncbi:MAG: beta-glucoside-specific PTS transporter subunit IIABC [Clostridiales bacterium]|nr:beta-glucoside-specific PTS transporter subunit IIABC [Clostridiales bacterium]